MQSSKSQNFHVMSYKLSYCEFCTILILIKNLMNDCKVRRVMRACRACHIIQTVILWILCLPPHSVIWQHMTKDCNRHVVCTYIFFLLLVSRFIWSVISNCNYMYIIIYWVGVNIICRLLIRDKIILHASTCIHILNRLHFFRYGPTCHSLIDDD